MHRRWLTFLQEASGLPHRPPLPLLQPDVRHQTPSPGRSPARPRLAESSGGEGDRAGELAHLFSSLLPPHPPDQTGD
eukprot:3724333-Pyramimonas_sp.AAC.1